MLCPLLLHPQLAINEAERYKNAVSSLETQAKLAATQISSIKDQLEQKTAQLDEAQVSASFLSICSALTVVAGEEE